MCVCVCVYVWVHVYVCISGKNYSQGLLLKLVLTGQRCWLPWENTHATEPNINSLSQEKTACVCVCPCRCVYSRYMSFWVDLSLPTMKGKICPFFTKKKYHFCLSHTRMSSLPSLSLSRWQNTPLLGCGVTRVCRQEPVRAPLLFSLSFFLSFFSCFFPFFSF